jgi:hypothetical protein
MKYLIMAILLVSCGQSSEVDVKDSNHTIGGETKSIITLELPFISQVNELCKDLYIERDYVSVEYWKQAVAKCTFDNISVLNIDGISQDGFNDIISDLCSKPEYENETICQ